MPIRREVYTTVGNGCGCNRSSSKQDSNRIQLNVFDDFKLLFSFSDTRTTPPSLIPMDIFDLTIEFYTLGHNEIYKVVKRGMNFVNCLVDCRTSTLKAIFDNHGLKSGQLYGKFTFQFPDPEFPDGYGRTIVIQDMGITLIDCNNG